MKALTVPGSMALYVSHKLWGKGAMRLTMQGGGCSRLCIRSWLKIGRSRPSSANI